MSCPEIYIRQLAYHEAELKLRKELDDLYLRKCGRVRIVHGKGQGILKQMVREYLAKQPFVSKVYDAPLFAGGSGATIAEFFP